MKHTFMIWLRHFQPHKAVRPYPLLLDGHSSQKGLQAVEFCEQKRNIHMVCLPHIHFQPWDRSFCKPLKSNNNECNSLMRKQTWRKNDSTEDSRFKKEKLGKKLHRHLLRAKRKDTTNITVKTAEH